MAQSALIRAAIKWSKKTGKFRDGNPQLHNLAAAAFTENAMFDKAQQHFLRGDQPHEFARMLARWSSQGYGSEADLFLARAVLGLLVLKNMRDANALYSEVTKGVGELTPMHNFLRFLLLVLERDAAPLFQDLRKRYAPTIDRDGSLHMFLDAIGQTYYNIQPTQNGFASMMQDMMKGLMGPQ